MNGIWMSSKDSRKEKFACGGSLPQPDLWKQFSDAFSGLVMESSSFNLSQCYINHPFWSKIAKTFVTSNMETNLSNCNGFNFFKSDIPYKESKLNIDEEIISTSCPASFTSFQYFPFRYSQNKFNNTRKMFNDSNLKNFNNNKFNLKNDGNSILKSLINEINSDAWKLMEDHLIRKRRTSSSEESDKSDSIESKMFPSLLSRGSATSRVRSLSSSSLDDIYFGRKYLHSFIVLKDIETPESISNFNPINIRIEKAKSEIEPNQIKMDATNEVCNKIPSKNKKKRRKRKKKKNEQNKLTKDSALKKECEKPDLECNFGDSIVEDNEEPLVCKFFLKPPEVVEFPVVDWSDEDDNQNEDCEPIEHQASNFNFGICGLLQSNLFGRPISTDEHFEKPDRNGTYDDDLDWVIELNQDDQSDELCSLPLETDEQRKAMEMSILKANEIWEKIPFPPGKIDIAVFQCQSAGIYPIDDRKKKKCVRFIDIPEIWTSMEKLNLNDDYDENVD